MPSAAADVECPLWARPRQIAKFENSSPAPFLPSITFEGYGAISPKVAASRHEGMILECPGNAETDNVVGVGRMVEVTAR